MAIKHVGRLLKNRRKVIVAYKVVPGEPENCVVVNTESLDAADHDTLMTLVESNASQNTYEFAEVMHRSQLTDGRNMLVAFHKQGKMIKIRQDEVEMTPDTNTSIRLDELLKIIAEQKGVTVADLAMKGPNGETVQAPTDSPDPASAYVQDTSTDNGVITDEQLAAQYRSQADSLFKEAKRLREQAEELVPTKRKAKATESV